jgi:hypothetical protein
VWRRFLDSDHTVDTLAAAAGLTPRQIIRAFRKPGPVNIRIFGQIARALDCWLKPELVAAENAWRTVLPSQPRLDATGSFRGREEQ